ncbi:uncharacterized protein METZ01_LOCUS396510, partial [marine metagenome]
IEGKFNDQFPIDIYQTGSGTSSNMNCNEIIANRASELLYGEIGSREPVHPNNHVNLGQSSNDVIPTAIHIAANLMIQNDFIPALEELSHELDQKVSEFKDVMKIGRTHLQEATPITMGQEFSGYVQMVNNGTGIYYKLGMPTNTDSQIIADFGFHLDHTIQSTNYFGYNRQYQSVFLEIATEYKHELFNEMIVGVFRPVIVTQGGGAVDVEPLTRGNRSGQWIFTYSSGIGIQFYNQRFLNEIMLKLNQYFSTDRTMAFQLAIYWEKGE